MKWIPLFVQDTQVNLHARDIVLRSIRASANKSKEILKSYNRVSKSA